MTTYDGSTVYTVSQVNGYVKRRLDEDELLSGLLVGGEISNYKRYPSGHHYFSLKDEAASIRCVLFKGDAAGLRFQPANGMKVIAFGRVSVFPRDGQYQLYCRQLLPQGVGELHAAFEALKKKLEEEGLFDPARKKPLPRFPTRIVLVTSSAGAAVRDMIRILGERWPMAQVTVVPVKVQGEGAGAEIAAGIDRANREKLGELIITGRGGGSMEDLWAFNEEVVARAICRSKLPVISAVGHEPDVTISDYAADLRAATPSNAAELAVPDQREVRRRLDRLGAAMARCAQGELSRGRMLLDALRKRRVLADPKAPIEDKRLFLDSLQRRMAAALEIMLSARRGQAGRLAASLDALSPLKVLGRGYSIARLGGTVLSSVEQARLGDRLEVRVADGSLAATVTGKERESWQKKS